MALIPENASKNYDPDSPQKIIDFATICEIVYEYEQELYYNYLKTHTSNIVPYIIEPSPQTQIVSENPFRISNSIKKTKTRTKKNNNVNKNKKRYMMVAPDGKSYESMTGTSLTTRKKSKCLKFTNYIFSLSDSNNI